MSSTRTLTLADVAWPRAGALENTFLVIAASLMTGLAAQVAFHLPWTPVPVSGQTFAVLLSGALLGPKRGFLAQVLYIAEGAAGLPVFAGGAAGLAELAGPSGGYLVSFPIAAAIAGWLATRGWDRHFGSTLLAMLIGSSVIFVLGASWLSRFVPVSTVLSSGVLPFLPGDVIKAALAALALPAAWRGVRRGGQIG